MALTDQQCQNCHKGSIDGFPSGHPELGKDGLGLRGAIKTFGTFPVQADQILTPSYLLTPTSLQTLLEGSALVGGCIDRRRFKR